MAWGVCNSTLDDQLILPTSERILVGDLTFHSLAVYIAGGCTGFAIIFSFYLIIMHAMHYTEPREQKHIIRIIFMVPVYAVASFLALKYYWHAVYFSVLSTCYEAFAISSFFALMCQYTAPGLHEQKTFFRQIRPIRPWVLPISWFRACCGGERGIWRTPRSGLTWFNIIWIGIYQYCFIRVVMTIVSVVTQHYGVYCESSDSFAFGHIWTLLLDSLAVTVAMYCIIQYYIQMKVALVEHRPFAKVLSIKLVIFLSFWQTVVIAVVTSSTVHLLEPNSVLAYPDIKIGITSLLLCFEMGLFSLIHLWSFPVRPYKESAPPVFFPVPDPAAPDAPPPVENERGRRQGGFLGWRAFVDAANIWDIVKAFGRGTRWLFCGMHKRKHDVSYAMGAKAGHRAGSDESATYGPGPYYGGSDYPDHGAHGRNQYRTGRNGGAPYPPSRGVPPTAEQHRWKNAQAVPTTMDPNLQVDKTGMRPIREERIGLMTDAQAIPTSTTYHGVGRR